MSAAEAWVEEASGHVQRLQREHVDISPGHKHGIHFTRWEYILKNIQVIGRAKFNCLLILDRTLVCWPLILVSQLSWGLGNIQKEKQ